jgi:putative addiction module component (TIGR02574 family)
MTAARKLDKQITNYLTHLNVSQKQAVLTVVEAFATQQDSDIWKDKTFAAEMDRRLEEYERGNAKVITLDELEARVRAGYKARSKRKRK